MPTRKYLENLSDILCHALVLRNVFLLDIPREIPGVVNGWVKKDFVPLDYSRRELLMLLRAIANFQSDKGHLNG